jgi:outer membrane protein assembly factor BamB
MSRLALALAVFVLLVACGDGDESAETGADETAVVVTTTHPVGRTTSTAPPSATSSGGTAVDDATTASAGAPAASLPISLGDAATGSCPDDLLPAAAAFALGSGELLWVACSAEDVYRSVVGATEDAVYLHEATPAPSAGLLVLDASTGEQRWSTPIAPFQPAPEGPVAAGGVVVETVVDGGGQAIVVGLDASGGAERWRSPAAPDSVAMAQTEAVVVLGGVHGLVGLDRSTGTEIWRAEAVRYQAQRGVERAATALSGDTLIFPSEPDVVAVDVRSGAERWRAPSIESPTAFGGTVVGIASEASGGTVRALDAATGAERWTAPGAPSYGDLWAVGDGIAAVLTESNIEALALDTGAVRWQRARSEVQGAQPQLIAGTNLAVLWEGAIGVLSTADGSTIWEATEPIGSPFMSDVFVAGDVLFVSVNSLPWGD